MCSRGCPTARLGVGLTGITGSPLPAVESLPSGRHATECVLPRVALSGAAPCASHGTGAVGCFGTRGGAGRYASVALDCLDSGTRSAAGAQPKTPLARQAGDRNTGPAIVASRPARSTVASTVPLLSYGVGRLRTCRGSPALLKSGLTALGPR